MNKPIRRLAFFAMVLFGVLLVNVTYIQVFQGEALREHPFNGRQYANQLTQPRGPILVGSEEVAFSEPHGRTEDVQDQRYYSAVGLSAHLLVTYMVCYE